MLSQLAIIIGFGFVINFLFTKIRFPPLLGFIAFGMCFGYVSGFNSESNILDISYEIKSLAMIILMLRIGLGLKKKELNQEGIFALKLGSLPFLFESFFTFLISYYFLKFGLLPSMLLGVLISPVSPAIIVPKMLEHQSNKKLSSVATLILGATSLDNVLGILFFSIIFSFAQMNGSTASIISIILSPFLSVLYACILSYAFIYFTHKKKISDMISFAILIFLAVVLRAFENKINCISSITILVLGFILLEKKAEFSHKISKDLAKIWILAEILLFTIVGIEVVKNANSIFAWKSFFVLSIAMIGRLIGVHLSLLHKPWRFRKYIFLTLTPKATVQATLISLLLTLNIPHSSEICDIVFFAVLFTSFCGSMLFGFSMNKISSCVK